MQSNSFALVVGVTVFELSALLLLFCLAIWDRNSDADQEIRFR